MPGKSLSRDEKMKLMAWKKVGVPNKEMARLLDRHESSIRRFWVKQREFLSFRISAPLSLSLSLSLSLCLCLCLSLSLGCFYLFKTGAIDGHLGGDLGPHLRPLGCVEGPGLSEKSFELS